MPSEEVAKKVWKHAWKVLAGTASVLAIVFGSLKDATMFFLDLFTKQLPTVDDITRIQITLVIIGGAVLGLLIWHILRSRQTAEVKPNTQTNSQEIHEEYPKTNSAYDHLVAYLFWDQRYYIDKRHFPKDVRKGLPSQRLITNIDTKGAYLIPLPSELASLIMRNEIRHVDEIWSPLLELKKWAESKGYTYFHRAAKPEELQSKPEHSGASSVTFTLSGFELVTDRLAYKVGDTIRASVKVLSLTLGTTTVRLIAPSGRQLVSKDTGFHLSGTFNFDLADVEQSWEKGIWRVTAQQGSMFAEQKIEIL